MKTIDIESRIDPENIQSKLEQLNSLLQRTMSVQAFPIPMEEEFQASYNENTRLGAKITIFLGLIFFAASSVFDLAFFSHDFTSVAVRLFIASPLLFILASMSFAKYFYYFQQYYVLASVFIVISSLVIIAAIIPVCMKDLLYQSCTFTLFFTTTLSRLQFRFTLYASIMTLLIFNIGHLFSGITLPLYYYWSLFGNNYLLFAAACLCLIASYFNESNARKQFLLTYIVKMENALLAHLSHYDKLTNVANRRYFEEILEKEWRRAIRTNHTLSLLFIDFDYFKQYNDRYGHQAGDRVLSEIAKIFIKCVRRAGDFVARFGGDEFIIILPDNSLEDAVALAKTIMQELKKLAIDNADSKISPLVTVTLGITAITPTVDISSDVLIKQADLALQYGKSTVRNNIYIYSNDGVQLVT